MSATRGFAGFVPTETGGGGGVGVSDHGDLTGLSDDDHTQYVHNDSARTITAVHTFSPGSSSAPFTLGANAYDQKVSRFNADLLDGLDSLAFALASHTHAASDIVSGTLTLARGGTGSDLSATGGTKQAVFQASGGGNLSVRRIAVDDVPFSGTDKLLGQQ